MEPPLQGPPQARPGGGCRSHPPQPPWHPPRPLRYSWERPRRWAVQAVMSGLWGDRQLEMGAAQPGPCEAGEWMQPDAMPGDATACGGRRGCEQPSASSPPKAEDLRTAVTKQHTAAAPARHGLCKTWSCPLMSGCCAGALHGPWVAGTCLAHSLFLLAPQKHVQPHRVRPPQKPHDSGSLISHMTSSCSRVTS